MGNDLMKTKIVRKNTPTIAEENGDPGNFEEVDLRIYPQGDKLFRTKIVEEAREVFAAKNRVDLLYELADLKQVIEEYMTFAAISEEDLDVVQHAKEISNGSFRTIEQSMGFWVQVMNPCKDMENHFRIGKGTQDA